MKIFAAFCLFASVVGTLTADEPNQLTSAETKAGWVLLFDGKSTEGWRSYQSAEIQKDGWVVEEGTLHKPAGVKAGDIMTVETFENFEFSWEWKILEKGNNGVKYFITEERGATVGHEYQMIDDSKVKDEFSSTASFYLVAKPNADKPLKAPGEWNSSRIVVNKNNVEHWLNGTKVLEYECGSEAVLTQVAKTKFKKYPGFGNKVTGHILLTDHKDACWFRNLKLRKL